MKTLPEPKPYNHFLRGHGNLLLSSFQRLTGKNLLKQEYSSEDSYRVLFEAPFCVVSHNTEDDPIFNYANQAALSVFEMSWPEFTCLPSRKSAESINREDRDRLLARVSKNGFIDDYQGVRISSSGTRFWIEEATVWNLINECGGYCGQAAVLYNWRVI
jgi:hypothetical protein